MYALVASQRALNGRRPAVGLCVFLALLSLATPSLSQYRFDDFELGSRAELKGARGNDLDDIPVDENASRLSGDSTTRPRRLLPTSNGAAKKPPRKWKSWVNYLNF